MDNDWEQYKLEATLREMLENGDESPHPVHVAKHPRRGCVGRTILSHGGCLWREHL